MTGADDNPRHACRRAILEASRRLVIDAIIIAMKLTRDEVLHIAELARLGLSAAEVERLQGDLSEILSYAERLQQVDLSAISPAARVQSIENVLRDDVVMPSFPRQAIIANAPHTAAGCFKVPPVLE